MVLLSLFLSKIKNFLATSSIHNYSILFVIIMKDEGLKVFKLVKQALSLMFSKIIPFWLAYHKIHDMCFNYYM